jgi:tRNA-specific 2-thiouridylase
VKQKVIVAMSGGVDSSLTAALLLAQGYAVVGLTMRLGLESLPSAAQMSDPAVDAARVAAQLGIEHHVVDFSEFFQRQVIAPFSGDYSSGRTPNPCVLCNNKLKFGVLLDKALELGGDFLATGHYVRRAQSDGHYHIRKAIDPKKDQSYFLFGLTQAQLKHCLFPLGEMTKEQVRQAASELDLAVAQKTESQDICFIPDGDYIGFLEAYGIERSGGDIVHVDGQVLAQHQGLYRYTIGQRKGLGIGWSEPLYVVALDTCANRVIVGEKQHLLCERMQVADCNWSIAQPQQVLHCGCRIRYRHQEVPARLEPQEDGRVLVVFEEPQRGVTPGQAAVFYDGDLVIGGGWIR